MDNKTQKIVNKAEKIDVGQQTNNIYNLLDIKAAIIMLVVLLLVSGFFFVNGRNSNNDNTANTNSTQNSNAQSVIVNAQPTATPINTNVIANQAVIKPTIEGPKPTPTIKLSPIPVKTPKKTPSVIPKPPNKTPTQIPTPNPEDVP